MDRFRLAMERRGAVWYAYKLLLLAAGVGGVSLIYFFTSEATLGRQTHFMTRLDEAVPFLPWTWWIYFPGYLAGLLFSGLVIRDERILVRTVAAILAGQMLCAAAYMTFPSTFPRPAGWTGDGLTAAAIHWFWGFDPPNNTFPSSHVMISTLASLALFRDRHRLRMVQYLSTLGVLVTIHTTKQHYLIDGVAGVAVALLVHWLLFVWGPRRFGDVVPTAAS